VASATGQHLWQASSHANRLFRFTKRRAALLLYPYDWRHHQTHATGTGAPREAEPSLKSVVAHKRRTMIVPPERNVSENWQLTPSTQRGSLPAHAFLHGQNTNYQKRQTPHQYAETDQDRRCWRQKTQSKGDRHNCDGHNGHGGVASEHAVNLVCRLLLEKNKKARFKSHSV